MSLTVEQKNNIVAAIEATGLQTAGNNAVAKALNGLLMTGTVVKSEKTLIPKAEILAALSDDEVCALLAFFETDSNQAKAFKYRWDTLAELDMSHPVTRASISALSGIAGADKIAYLLALGERPKTKADELIGRMLTADDIAEARS